MKKILCALLLVSVFFPLAASDDLLVSALELIGRSKADGCAICANDEGKKAIGIIDSLYKPGTRIKTSDDSFFMKTADCRNNEVVLSSRRAGEKKTLSDGTEITLPLVTYRIHTVNDHLAGINARDYTPDSLARPFKKINAAKNWKGSGELELVPYPYGDGKCFIYFSKQNILQFQCKVVSMQ
jgi:hypothetical protein